MTIDNSEIWKPIVGFEETYEISTAYRVASLPRKGRPRRRILKPCPNSHGCPQVQLYLRGKRTNHKVAHLVADAFLPAKSSTDQVLRHLNDNPADNRIANLAWGTYSDNQQDSIRNDKHRAPKGVANGGAKLTEDDVREIRRLYATGNFTRRELARQFGVSVPTISKIVNRQTWKHVA